MRYLSSLALGAFLWPAVFAQSHVSTQWTRGYGDSRYFCLPESAVVAGDGDLWIICDGHDYNTNKQVVTAYRIDGNSGDLKFATELRTRLSLRPFVWEGSHQLFANGSKLGVLTSTTSGGQTQMYEGVFLTPLDEHGSPGVAILVIPKGSQLQQVMPMNGGGLVAAADQSPLSIRKLGPNGTLIWNRVLSAALALPTVAVFPDDSLCITAQLSTGKLPRPILQLMRLDSLGHVTKQIPLAAAQGAVAVGQDGRCAVLYSPTFESHARRLSGFDAKLNREWDTAVPLEGSGGGGTYTLDTLPDGFLATELTGDKRVPVIAKFSPMGELVWMEPLPSGFERFVLGASGSYLIMVGMVGGDHNEALRVSKIQIK